MARPRGKLLVMSSNGGHLNDADLSGGLWSHGATLVAATGSAAHFTQDSSAESYPNRYLRPGWRQRRARNRSAPDRAAAVPLSLLFPILVLLLISVTLRPDSSSEGIDVQVGLRLVGYALAALAVLFALGRRKLHVNILIVGSALLPIFIAATALYAPEPLFSFTAGLAHLSLLLFAWYMVRRYGQSRAVLAIVLTGMIIGILSIVAFYGFPDLGRSVADALNGDLGGRMRGVAAQPNSLGSISALTVLLAVMHVRAFSTPQRILAVGAALIGLFCLVYSDSRTSIVALPLCLGLWWICRANAALNLFAVVGIALVVALVIGFVPDVTALLAREGTGYDFSSFNGRSRIWTVAWEYIQAHPIIGQGYGSSRWILPKDDRLFSAAVHAHNVYLELLFSGGAVALAMFAGAVVIAIIRSATKRRVEALILLLFFLVVGVTEATPYAGLPLFQAFVFYIALSLCLAPSPQRPRAQRSRSLRNGETTAGGVARPRYIGAGPLQ